MILRQKLSRSPDERFAAPVLIRSRRLADEHQLRVRIADAENSLRACAREMRAFCANRNPRLDRCEQGRFFRFHLGGTGSVLSLTARDGHFEAQRATFAKRAEVFLRAPAFVRARRGRDRARAENRSLIDHLKFCAQGQFL